MAQIKCSCGNVYEDTFKFCPECAAPNPSLGKQANQSTRKKFTRINQTSAPTGGNTIIPKKIPIVADRADTYNAEEDEQTSGPDTISIAPRKISAIPHIDNEPAQDNYADTDEYEEDNDTYENYEDEETDDYEDEAAEETVEGEDYEDYDEDEEDQYKPPTPARGLSFPTGGLSLLQKKGKSKKAAPLASPYDNSVDEYDDGYEDEEEYEEEYYEPRPVKKKKSPPHPVARTTTARPKKRPIQAKHPSEAVYDPNFDGYYDDRLPAILDEVTKTSHLDVILKTVLAVICLAAVITYCIFYLNV